MPDLQRNTGSQERNPAGTSNGSGASRQAWAHACPQLPGGELVTKKVAHGTEMSSVRAKPGWRRSGGSLLLPPLCHSSWAGSKPKQAERI